MRVDTVPTTKSPNAPIKPVLTPENNDRITQDHRRRWNVWRKRRPACTNRRAATLRHLATGVIGRRRWFPPRPREVGCRHNRLTAASMPGIRVTVLRRHPVEVHLVEAIRALPGRSRDRGDRSPKRQQQHYCPQTYPEGYRGGGFGCCSTPLTDGRIRLRGAYIGQSHPMGHQPLKEG
jgi:hypothetical protein